MSSILFGLVLISAATQTALALFAEGNTLALPFAMAAVIIGFRSVKTGIESIRDQVLVDSGAADNQAVP
jgi:hypothetical protein